MRLVFSSVFEQDFAELVTLFSAEASSGFAVRFEQSTYKLIEMLLQHPEMGRLRKDLKPEGIRSFRLRGFDRYLLFYQIRGEDLVLLRLRYGGMNLPSLFYPSAPNVRLGRFHMLAGRGVLSRLFFFQFTDDHLGSAA